MRLVRIFCFSWLAACLTAKTYSVEGLVIALDTTAGTMLVAHKPIAKFMPAMAMPFRLADRQQLTGLHPGMQIAFDLVTTKAGSVARNVRASGLPDEPIAPPKDRLHVGDMVPDFTLVNQKGSSISLNHFRGKVLVIDFIYTRCPLPDVCPRLSANFAALHKRYAAQDVVLLSITVDPDFDTPQVLRDYASRWGARDEKWQFLTGDIAKIAAALGEVYWTGEGSIGHNISTAVVGRDGRLASLTDGASWRVDQLERLIGYELEKTK